MRQGIGLFGMVIGLVGWILSTPAEAGTAVGSREQALPLSEVVLYTSGVGYFQRDGVVDGRSHVDLRFKAERVNDLLKSLVVQDLDGGQVSAVTYDSRDPITKTLKTFSVDLTTSLSLGDLLDRIRGEQVEIATPTSLRGTILGVERKKERAGDKDVVETEYLNLLTADGLRSIALAQIQRVEVMNPALKAELRQALELLASSRDTQKKTVQLGFDGQGRRRVRVGYIDEAPVWKTSYRLALSDKERPFLQGWAIVENTTDEDWEGVRLSLISGRPISFTMDLYEPLYIKRPVVVSELYETLRPQVYDEAVAAAKGAAERARASESAMAPKAAPAPSMMRPGETPVTRYAAPPEMALQQGVSSAARGEGAGELFQYAIKTPLTLARLRSAMIPIVNEAVESSKVSIYNQTVNARYPLNGVRLKNVTALHLLQGPVTVFDGGIYAGDARLGDLAPGQERLISYALDLKTEVVPQDAPRQDQLVTASLKKGTLIVTRKRVEERTYAVTNRDAKSKTVLIEHPLRPAWQLVAPAAASERTRDVYRFAVPVDAGAKTQLLVREEQQGRTTMAVGDVSTDQYRFYVEAKEIGPKVREALKQVVTLRDRLDQTATRRASLEGRIKEIAEEQGRIRDNMGRLAQSSELYTRYVTKLGQQENEIEGLRKEIQAQKVTEETQRRALNEYLLGLDLD